MTDYRKAAVVQLAWIGPPALAHKLLLLEHLTSLACPIVFFEILHIQNKECRHQQMYTAKFNLNKQKTAL